MAFARLLRNLVRDEEVGARVVPIIPDEARTFGMDALFREIEIYAAARASCTSRSTPTCCSPTASRRTGQILEEGITEAGVDGRLHRRRHVATPPAACRWCRSSSSIRCSASSGSAT